MRIVFNEVECSSHSGHAQVQRAGSSGSGTEKSGQKCRSIVSERHGDTSPEDSTFVEKQKFPFKKLLAGGIPKAGYMRALYNRAC
jgi:hypothetical protein